MLLGVVSDTHNHLTNVERIVEIFNRAGVDRVVHTGDITQAKTLTTLADLAAPLCGVFGNNDLERAELDAACRRYGFDFAAGTRRFDWGGRRVLVVHDPLDVPRDATGGSPGGGCDVVLHGHTHRTVVERHAGRLMFNPGECAGHLTGYNRVGFVDLNTLDVRIESF